MHINSLQLKETKKLTEANTVHLQKDNITALAYLIKMGGTKSSELNRMVQEIWEFLTSKSIITPAEYLPRSMNFNADWGIATSGTQPSGK